MFARWGIPYEVISDNGPQHFAKEYSFIHKTSSPTYVQANGGAERCVQTSKKVLNQDDPFMALLVYRSTPHTATGKSPAQLIMNRNLRTTLPTLEKNIITQEIDHEEARRKDDMTKAKYAYFYNRRYSAKPMESLTPGEMSV